MLADQRFHASVRHAWALGGGITLIRVALARGGVSTVAAFRSIRVAQRKKSYGQVGRRFVLQLVRDYMFDDVLVERASKLFMTASCLLGCLRMRPA